MRLAASHMTVSQAGSDREHDAVATVLIIGASRGIGLEAVKAALEAGHSVRALARTARRIRVEHPKLEKMAGDALQMATVKRALTGVDVVIQSLGVSAGPEVILKSTRFFSKATRVLVTAMEEARVKRLICVTGFGAGDSRGHGGLLYNAVFHLLLGRVYYDKDVQEPIVPSSKLDWVIVRAVMLTDGPKTNAYRALVAIGHAGLSRGPTRRISSSSRSTMTPFCIRRRCSRAPSLLRGVSPRGRRAAEQRDELASFHVDFALSLIASSASVCHPASLIFTRTVSIILPSATMRSACADASPARTSSTSSSAVNPFANISASVQPSGEAASNSRARRRSGLGPWRRR